MLRDWLDADPPHMRGLFDAPDMAANTDIPFPFDADAFLVRIRRRRAQGIVDLAVTRDGGSRLASSHSTWRAGCWVRHRPRAPRPGSGVAFSAVDDEFCHEELGFTRVRLSIVQGNGPRSGSPSPPDTSEATMTSIERTNGLGQPKLLETWHWIAPVTSG